LLYCFVPTATTRVLSAVFGLQHIAAWEAYATPWANSACYQQLETLLGLDDIAACMGGVCYPLGNPTHVLELHGHPLVRNDSTDQELAELWDCLAAIVRHTLPWHKYLCCIFYIICCW
jgi:hypothetical protein